jgi:hypothetical protein
MQAMHEVSEQLNAVNVVIALLKGEQMPLSHTLKMQETKGTIQNAPTQLLSGDHLTPESLKGLTQLAALKRIAHFNEGRVRTGHAKRLLLKAGLIQNPKNAANIIFNVIRKSEQFSRIFPGVYQLKESPEKTNALDLLNSLEAVLANKSA